MLKLYDAYRSLIWYNYALLCNRLFSLPGQCEYSNSISNSNQPDPMTDRPVGLYIDNVRKVNGKCGQPVKTLINIYQNQCYPKVVQNS